MAPVPPAIPPEVRSRLKRLSLTTRRLTGVHGFGAHASSNKGAGIEFAQYRSYEPGDDPRGIDWKLYARSDKFFIREAEQEGAASIWILIDASASMNQADRHTPDWSRFDAAKILAMCIAQLALQQGDRFGWIVLGGAGPVMAEPRAGRAQNDRLQVDLARSSPQGKIPDAARLGSLWERIAPRDLVLFLSDCFDERGVAEIERLAGAGREVLAVQLLTVEERDFPFEGGFRFRDQEDEAELIGDGKALREDYLARFAKARAGLAARLDAAGIRHTSYFLDEPIDAPLHDLFGVGAMAR